MGYVRAKIGLTVQFDRHQPGNYLKPCEIPNFLSPIFGLFYMHVVHVDVFKKTIIIWTVDLPKKEQFSKESNNFPIFEKWTGMKNTGLKIPEKDQIYVEVGFSYYLRAKIIGEFYCSLF